MSHASSGGAAPGLRDCHVSRGHYAHGVLRNLSIYVWQRRAEEPEAQDMLRMSHTLAEAYPSGFGTLHWVLSGVGLPAANVRHTLGEVMRLHGPKLAEVHVVLEGGGFWASAYRGLATGLIMAAGGTAAVRVHAAIAEAAAALAEPHRHRTGVSIGAGEIVTAASHLRAAL